MHIKNKTAIITGASSGLGAAVSEALVKEGAKVFGLARHLDKLQKLKDALGESFIPVTLDISDAQEVKNWVDKTFSDTNVPDILINNAGAGIFGKIDEIPEEEWLAMINTNLNGMYYLTSAVARLMKQTDYSSHIINIGSILGSTGRAESAAYCTTKFGVQGFSDALFKELRFFNIKVTCFNPGSIGFCHGPPSLITPCAGSWMPCANSPGRACPDERPRKDEENHHDGCPIDLTG